MPHPPRSTPAIQHDVTVDREPIASCPQPPELVLASRSPRRSALLRGAGLDFEVRPAAIDERRRPGETPAQLVERLARGKARAVATQLGAMRRWVLGADTVVALGSRVLGKPIDAADAVAMLRLLLGSTHRVLTGVAVVGCESGHCHFGLGTSRVALRRASEAEIRRYVAGGEPFDKAGACAVQGEGRRFVLRIDGEEDNVVGLPLDLTRRLLQAAAFPGANRGP